MLRAFVIAFGVLLIGGSLIGFFTCARAAMIGPMILGILLLVGTVFERGRYRKAEAQLPGPGFERTPETFSDPAGGGAVVDVWYNKATGERRYVQRH